MDGQNIPPSEASTKPSKATNWFAIACAGLLFVVSILGVAVIYLWQKQRGQLSLVDNSTPSQNVRVARNPYEPVPQQPATSTPAPNPPPLNLEPPKPGNYIEIQWYKDLIPATLKSKAVEDKGGGITRYKVGKVFTGGFAGKELYLEAIPGLGTEYKHYVLTNDVPVYLDDEKLLIKGIDDLPETIAFVGTNYVLKKNWVAFKMYSDIKKLWKVFSDPKLGDFYLTDEGCFVVELPDHTAITYDFIISFVNKDTRELEVEFNDGSKNADPYTYTRIVGCGADCRYLAEVNEIKLNPQVRLKPAGKTSNGEELFELKDINAPELKTLYNDKNTVAYYNTGSSYEQLAKNKYTYGQFLSYRPLLYWKDPIGRWIEIKNDRFQIAAEMCKPVIYLYPKKPTELSVKVAPNGGFTFTRPLYNGGWQVLAYPDGTVKNFSNGKKYPYLFWEGIGLNYPAQEKGFVVKAGDLDKFFSQKLALLGLAGREARDFKDYWLPRLKGLNKPYYKISFLKKEQMDEIAPLQIGPDRPTSVIRVMMTAKGIDSFEALPAQELPLPQPRAGFTVVEWGGAVLK